MTAMAFPSRSEPGLGRFQSMTETEEIAQSVRLILTTRRGERPFRPDFGARLDRFAFEGADTTTRSLIRQEVVAALQRWEPRIWGIEVAFDGQLQEGVLVARVSYRLRRGGAAERQTVALKVG